MIRSTFSGFSSAQMALTASQRALDVVGQNISNLNTAGYTRQRLDLSSISPVGVSFSEMQNNPKVGQGVMMNGITQVRDPFLDIQYRNHLAQVGTVDAMDSILGKIGNTFDETDKAAIRDALTKVVSQLNNMAKPSDANQGVSDTLVRSSMEVLLNIIHQNAKDVQTVQDDIVTKLESTDLDKINGYLTSIAELNSSIKSSQILGSPALELQDQRNNLIDQLATYLPIKVSYNKMDIGSGISVDTMKINFTDTDGTQYTLVDDSKAGNMAFDFNDATKKGSLTINSLKADGTLDPSADLSNKLGDGILKGTLDMLNKAGVFDTTDTKGVGYYQQFFDMFVDTFATTMNNLNKKADGTAQDLFVKSNPADAKFTASNIKISDDWMNGTIQINTSDKTGTDTAYDNVLKMVEALSTGKLEFKNPKDDSVVFKGTIFEAYDSIQSTQSIERQSTSTILKNKVSVMNQIADSKDSVSGVYLDEEVMNLMKFQQSYNAAARVMTAMDEALDILINKMGVVGR